MPQEHSPVLLGDTSQRIENQSAEKRRQSLPMNKALNCPLLPKLLFFFFFPNSCYHSSSWQRNVIFCFQSFLSLLFVCFAFFGKLLGCTDFSALSSICVLAHRLHAWSWLQHLPEWRPCSSCSDSVWGAWRVHVSVEYPQTQSLCPALLQLGESFNQAGLIWSPSSGMSIAFYARAPLIRKNPMFQFWRDYESPALLNILGCLWSIEVDGEVWTESWLPMGTLSMRHRLTIHWIPSGLYLTGSGYQKDYVGTVTWIWLPL